MSVIPAPAGYMRGQAPAGIQGLMASPLGLAGPPFARFEHRPTTPPLRGSRGSRAARRRLMRWGGNVPLHRIGHSPAARCRPPKRKGGEHGPGESLAPVSREATACPDKRGGTSTACHPCNLQACPRMLKSGAGIHYMNRPRPPNPGFLPEARRNDGRVSPLTTTPPLRGSRGSRAARRRLMRWGVFIGGFSRPPTTRCNAHARVLHRRFRNLFSPGGQGLGASAAHLRPCIPPPARRSSADLRLSFTRNSSPSAQVGERESSHGLLFFQPLPP